MDLCSHTKVGADKKQETVTVVLNENDVLWPDYRHMFIADCMDQVAIRLSPDSRLSPPAPPPRSCCCQ